ncbi:MAG TPA: carboxypeptidase-like regulatory domain-containing protein, partial [Polyangiaceae bacterium]|nr:carboxypeptidase-like regulatory domain-containing protein [Polyangiaceae bacterium]
MAHAETSLPRLGDTAWALPGIVRVGVPALGQARFSAAGTAGYGFTEAQSSSDGAHHRLSGDLAAAVAPLPELELALRFDGRLDMHPDDGGGAHSGAIGDPRLLVRAGAPVGQFVVGGELAGWFPGKDAPSITPSATTVDANVLGAWVPRTSPVIVAASAGFRFDNSKNAAPELDRLRFGDRLALGLSGENAALFGVGASAAIAPRTDLLGEFSADFLVGSSAPSISKSPMRVSVGARQHLSEAFTVELLAEVSPSGRPSLAANEPLVPIEPRFSILAGLRYRLPFGSRPAPPPSPAPEQEKRRTPVAVPERTTADLTVHVTGQGGAPLANVVVEVRVGEKTERLTAGENGDFVGRALPVGPAHVTVTAEGFTATERDVQIGAANEPTALELAPAPPSGQLRGLVRSFNG